MHIFKFNSKTNCFEVIIGNITVLLDIDKLELLFFSEKIKTSAWKLDDYDLLYTINSNCKHVYLLEILFNIPYDCCNWKFLNDNKYDYRISNIKYTYKYIEKIKIPSNFHVIKEYPGHIQTLGKTAGTMYNPYWLVHDTKIQETSFYIMYCEPGVFTYFDKKSLDKMIFDEKTNTIPTWFQCPNGYIAANLSKQYYMHQIIMDYFDHGSNTQSIDHINQNKLDNRTLNLRITSQSEQNKNMGKRSRKYNAKTLPDEIKQEDIPKFVVYYKEKVGKNKDKTREFFVIEKHPKMNGKRWATSKSINVPIIDKLNAAKEKLKELEKL